MQHCFMRYKNLLTDKEILHLWRLLEESGTLKMVFYSGGIRNDEEFLKYVRSDNIHFYSLYYDGVEAGFVWLNEMRERSARIHFTGFKNVYGKRAIRIGRFALSRILTQKNMNGTFLLDVVYGFTPKSNSLAVKFIQKIGAVIRGDYPHGSYNAFTQTSEDAVFSTATRESVEEIWANI